MIIEISLVPTTLIKTQGIFAMVLCETTDEKDISHGHMARRFLQRRFLAPKPSARCITAYTQGACHEALVHHLIGNDQVQHRLFQDRIWLEPDPSDEDALVRKVYKPLGFEKEFVYGRSRIRAMHSAIETVIQACKEKE